VAGRTTATIRDTMEKMEIFISWHGKRGHHVASALAGWLPQIVNAFNPWLSSSIDKGSRWRSEVAARLAKARAGIICLTPSSLTAPWLLFEAGAIAKPSEKTYACTLLIGLKSEDVADPLAQFQHTAITKEEFRKLVLDLNAALDSEQMPQSHVETAFEKWWPEIEQNLKNLPPDEPTKPPERSERELLAELLELTRSNSMSVADLQRATDMLRQRVEQGSSSPPLSSFFIDAGKISGAQRSQESIARGSLNTELLENEKVRKALVARFSGGKGKSGTEK
jgi:hypothetical protein